MSNEAQKPNDQSNSGEEKSEEFKNFEAGMKKILGLKKKDVERIKRDIPAPNDDESEESQQNS